MHERKLCSVGELYYAQPNAELSRIPQSFPKKELNNYFYMKE